MKKKIAFGAGILILCFVLLALGTFSEKPSREITVFDDSTYKQTRVTIGGEAFSALVADTNILHGKGLSGRSGLKDDQVMLFIFPESNSAGFWMKDMSFSIDILWLDENGKVISFASDVSPATYPKVFEPKSPARYVIEFNAGTLAHLGVEEGDTVIIP